MAICKILTDKDPVLHKVCHPVTRFDDRLADLMDDLRETLTDACGMGLAAPQIGILRRAVVVVISEEGDMLELINPEIVDQRGEQDGLEGCLSVPGKWAYIKRPQWVKVRAQDRNGDWFEAEGEGMTARCFCHEIEHLDGHMYYERAGRLFTEAEVDEMLQKAEEEA